MTPPARLAALAAAAALAVSGAALAQQAAGSAAADWHPVSAGNTWSITDSTCALDASWGDDTQLMITLHEDHHDLGIYNPHFQRVAREKVIPARFFANGRVIDGRAYQVIGHVTAQTRAYVSDVDDALLDAVAAAGSFQFRRGDELLSDLDMTGFPEALAAMRACEKAATPAAPPADQATDAVMDDDGTAPDDPSAEPASPASRGE